MSYAGCPGPSAAISAQFTLKMCVAAGNCKKKFTKTPYFGGSRTFKVIDVDTNKKSLPPVLVMISSMSLPIYTNGFKISMEKTVVVLFTHRRENINCRLKIDDKYVRVENKAKFLGLVFDSKLTWNHHVNHAVDKCKKRLNLLRAISGNKWGASKKTLLLVYRSLIRSVIEYGCIAYDSMGVENKRKLDSIQAQALRIACGAVAGTATAALQVDAGEPPLQLRRLQQQIQYAAKVKCDEHHPASSVF